MANTIHGLPYPVGTDRVMDGDNAIQALAEAIDLKALDLIVQAGTITGGTATSTSWAATQNFPVAFGAVPLAVVITGVASSFATVWTVASLTAANFGWRAQWPDGLQHTGSGPAYYIAIGKRA